MYIYQTINLINNKSYIGCSKFNPQDNPNYLGSGVLLKKAIEKYGKENFKKIILEECSTKEKLLQQEIFWIKTKKTLYKEDGYNICIGGQWGDTWTNNPRQDEIRKLFSDKYKGENNPNFGNRWNEQQKAAASKRCKITHQSLKGDSNPAKRPEVRQKISSKALGGNNSQALKWKIIDNNNKEYLVHGGIKRFLKTLNYDYQKFKFKINDKCRKSIDNWYLYIV